MDKPDNDAVFLPRFETVRRLVFPRDRADRTAVLRAVGPGFRLDDGGFFFV